MSKLLSVYGEVIYRAGLVAIFAASAHQLQWEWLRFLTSEFVLRVSVYLGMPTTRVTFDTIQIQGERFQFLISCTFADVFIGCIPLVWRLDRSLIRNLARLVLAATALFAFNAVRLETGQVLYSHDVPWMVADGILGGFAYLAVWLVIWHTRSWCLITTDTPFPPDRQSLMSASAELHEEFDPAEVHLY